MKNIFLFVFIFLFIFSKNSIAQISGTLDVSFSTDGKNLTPFLGNDIARGTVLQIDGKIVVVGNDGSGNITVARYLANGELDINFSGNGKVSTNVSNLFAEAHAVAMQADGKIVVVGNLHNTALPASNLYDFLVLRYLSNGTLDNSFDGDGILLSNSSLLDYYYDVTIQTDGKILLAGSQNSAWLVRRLNINGTLDLSFGNAGTASIPMQGNAKSIALQPDGKIIAGGETYTINASTRDFAAIRLNTTGILDTSFDTDGISKTDINVNSDDYGNALALQEDEKIVLVGKTFNINKYNIALVRYNIDGSLDTSFSSDGKQTSNISAGDDIANSVAIQPGGTIVLAGSTVTAQFSYIGFNNITHIVPQNNDFLVLNYSTQGNLEGAFSTDGFAKLAFQEGQNDFGYGICLQNDGKIIVVGSAENGPATDFGICRLHANNGFLTLKNQLYTSFGGEFFRSNCIAVQGDSKIMIAGGNMPTTIKSNFALARYNVYGRLDNTFSGDGKLIISSAVLGEYAYPCGMAIQADGKILIAGSANPGGFNKFAIIRLNANGTFDNTFGTNGMVFPYIGSYDICKAMLLQPDGKIVLAGTSNVAHGIMKFGIVRLNSDGSFDTSFDIDGKILISANIGSDDISSIGYHNGKIIITGTELDHDFIAYRINSDGSFDTSFDTDGKILTTFTNIQLLAQVSGIQADGKLIIGGKTSEDGGRSILIRYNVDGSLDNTFSEDGIYKPSTFQSEINSILIKLDGKILLSSFALYSSRIFQLLADGTLDDTFGDHGSHFFKHLGYGLNYTTKIAFGINDRVYSIGTYDNGTNRDFTLSIFLQCKTPKVSLFHPDNDFISEIATSYIANKIEAENWHFSSSKTIFQAVKSIDLLPGFRVEQNAVFKAEINPSCNYIFDPNPDRIGIKE
jgi:uncharacterized delta-60 repeat protein